MLAEIRCCLRILYERVQFIDASLHEMKWNNMKWNEMKWNEMKWNEMKRNEIKYNENGKHQLKSIWYKKKKSWSIIHPRENLQCEN